MKQITHGAVVRSGVRRGYIARESWNLPKDKDAEYEAEDQFKELDVQQLTSARFGYRLLKGFAMLRVDDTR